MANLEKFKALVHYICAQSPNTHSLGKTKLNKILWFAEREVYLRTGQPITGVKFIKMKFGLVPEPIDEVLSDLQRDHVLLVRDTEWRGKPKKEFISLLEPTLEGFTTREVSLINHAVLTICNRHTAQTISVRSHDEVWEIARIGEEIPLYSTYGRPGELQPEDIRWAHQQLEEIKQNAA